MENFSKNKRGRPKLFQDSRKTMRAIFPEGGDRTFLNRIYGQLAYTYLFEDPECKWLFEENKQGDWKRKTLQTEVGRLLDPELIREAGKHICKIKPRVKEGVVLIRGYRMSLQGKKQQLEGDWLTLTKEIENTINDFLMRYPETKKETLISSLHLIKSSIEDEEGE